MGLFRNVMRLGVFAGLLEQVRLSWQLFRDPRVPRNVKAIPILTILYLISPIDIAINVIPIVGQMEDVAVLGLGLTLFIRAAPQDVVNEHLSRIRGQARVSASAARQTGFQRQPDLQRNLER
jgi:uncharacterized membrane protein YkvA (DUF1232 family)